MRDRERVRGKEGEREREREKKRERCVISTYNKHTHTSKVGLVTIR